MARANSGRNFIKTEHPFIISNIVYTYIYISKRARTERTETVCERLVFFVVVVVAVHIVRATALTALGREFSFNIRPV